MLWGRWLATLLPWACTSLMKLFIINVPLGFPDGSTRDSLFYVLTLCWFVMSVPEADSFFRSPIGRGCSCCHLLGLRYTRSRLKRSIWLRVASVLISVTSMSLPYVFQTSASYSFFITSTLTLILTDSHADLFPPLALTDCHSYTY